MIFPDYFLTSHQHRDSTLANRLFYLLQGLAIQELHGIDRQVQLVGNLLIGILPRDFQGKDFPPLGRQFINSSTYKFQLFLIDIVIDLLVVYSLQ